MVDKKNNKKPGPGATVADYLHEGSQVRYYGDFFIKTAISTDGETWEDQKCIILGPKEGTFDDQPITVMGAMLTEKGIMIVYDSSLHEDKHTILRVGMALFDSHEPMKLLWRSEVPLYEHEVEGIDISVGTAYRNNGEIVLSWSSKSTDKVMEVRIPHPLLLDGEEVGGEEKLSITRHEGNPIIEPRQENDWEAAMTFNPAAFDENGNVHIVYRAQGHNGISVFGYALSKDGVSIHSRDNIPAYIPRAGFEGVCSDASFPRIPSSSGWGTGGCEDPRVTLLEGKVYLTYVAFDGYGQARAALSSIDLDDFLSHKWDKWTYPALISERPVKWGDGIKCISLLPEKIDGKYVIFYRKWPNICIDYVDDLEFGDDKKWLTAKAIIKPRPHYWDSIKVGVGATPLKTKDGWLLIYQAVGHQDPGKYKVGAMLLDLKDPSNVLARSDRPILEPDMWYENDWKPGITYPCGAVIKDGELLVYYGGGDKVVCVAKAPLDEFIKKLKDQKEVKLNLVSKKS